jgi:hypothetical protein
MAQSAMQSLLNVETLICSQPALAEKPNRPELLAANPADLLQSTTIGE